MSENLTYADLNVAELNTPRLQEDTHVPDSIYVEVKVKSLDTSAVASYKVHGPTGQAEIMNSKDSRRGKSCCSRTCVAVLIAMIVLFLLVLGLGLILMFLRSQKPSEEQESPKATMLEERGCPSGWIRNRKKCYFFSQSRDIKDWNTYRQECKEMDSDLVIINNKEELEYLFSQSKGHYYLLSLKYSNREKKWRWINNAEHRTDIFEISGNVIDYFCTVIGFDKVATASCCGSSTTQNMCEKAANISALPKMSEGKT
ncbi:C-type lectin domain family 5 member A-like isoform X2 [Struthio camelus]|uniref:C-type lectin domain family 5 member A-like isoform X2 n=1 Tax=Struthio camelus TaxID=8801 RepID=UPI00051E2085|nr:PREDICTED: C-type lectin domain family 5 member A-like isoform X2 [Struthio camelus australis]